MDVSVQERQLLPRIGLRQFEDLKDFNVLGTLKCFPRGIFLLVVGTLVVFWSRCRLR